jgi:hypothetical protein
MHALQVPLMAGAGSVYGGLAIHGLDSLHVVTEETPSCHLPHIHGIFLRSMRGKNGLKDSNVRCILNSKVHN